MIGLQATQSCPGSLALCKAALRFAHRARTLSLPGSAIMLLQRGLETLDKAVTVKGLSQVANRAGPKCLRTNPIVGEGRDENERHVVPLGKQVGLQLYAAHAGHLDIRNHTREVIEVVRPQELLGGCECIYDVSE